MPGSQLPALTAAAIAALNAAPAFVSAAGGQKAYSLAPQATQAPYVLVFGGSEVPWAECFVDDDDAPGGRACQIGATVVSLHRGTKEMDTIADAVLETWLKKATWASVPGLAAVRFVENQAPSSEEIADGILYSRTVLVRVEVNG